MFIYDKDMERVMQAKKREILFELEQTKERILHELSGVDKMTMTRLRQVLDDYNKIEYMITTKINAIEQRVIDYSGNIGNELEELQNTVSNISLKTNEALTIAKGKNRARVFTTTEDMQTFLSSADSVGQLQVGDNLYIVALEVPDYWVSEILETPNSKGYYYNVAQLETQKVNLTDAIGFISDTLIHTITTPNTEYTANQNCWVRCTLKGKYNVTNHGISINGVNIIHTYLYDETKTSTQGIMELSTILPIKKGQTIKTLNDGDYSLKFYAMEY